METAAPQGTMRCPSCRKQLPKGTVFCPWDGSALESVRASQSQVDPLIDAQVSDYIIQERIGAGGMGIVYRAIQPLIGKQVAIKVLKAEFANAQELVQRLLVEARVVNAIQHRGIIDIFGFGQLPDGRPYVVMELLQGLSLDQFIKRRGRVAADETVSILDEVLSALGAAHRAGVIHRDLKPGNIFLVEGSEGARAVKILDFGIAKVAASGAASPMTMQGMLLGTPEYMAPEQIRGNKVEATADLYAVGVIAFQMLTGARPFSGEQMSVLFAQVEEAPVSPSSLVAGIPPELERMVLRLLAKSPAERFQTAEAVRQELNGVLPGRGRRTAPPREAKTVQPADSPPTGAITARLSETASAKASKPGKGRWFLGGGLTALGLVVAGGAFHVLSQGASGQQEPAAAGAPDTQAAPQKASGEEPAGAQAASDATEEDWEEVELQEVLDSETPSQRPKRRLKPLSRKRPTSEQAEPPPSMTASVAPGPPSGGSNPSGSASLKATEAGPAPTVISPPQVRPVEAVIQAPPPPQRAGLAACRANGFDRRTQQVEILLARINCLEARVQVDDGDERISNALLGEISRLRHAAKTVQTARERMEVTQSVDALKARYDREHGPLVLPAMTEAPPPRAAAQPAPVTSPSEAPAAAVAEAPESSAHPRSRIDRQVLLQRVARNEAWLHEAKGQAVAAQAQGPLAELKQQAANASTAGERMAVSIQLDEWERKFLAKR
ncbi:Serine/threonine protein kinase [Stigmatella aurantiaca DW4/3-1]|uniref:non-specific serine/threonine protein kinase n=2 Tax=Stigmatella aurantiaca (strain DW4/3-1) TaxID=378806 RepID=E3FNB3_STIAD|nr:Serine/threonine protein kinase [Stigmatella aurantiaca DW4/3-1]